MLNYFVGYLMFFLNIVIKSNDLDKKRYCLKKKFNMVKELFNCKCII